MTARRQDLIEQLGKLLGQALVLLSWDGAVVDCNECAKALLPPSTLRRLAGTEGGGLFGAVLDLLRRAPANTTVETWIEVPGGSRLRCRATICGAPGSHALIALDGCPDKGPDLFGPEILSILNHEFRTPLATLCGFAELMLHRDFDEATKRTFLETIRGESFRLARLFKNLIDLQRMNAKSYSLQPEMVEFGGLLESACAHQRQIEPDRSIGLKLPESPTFARVDRMKISRALEILLEKGLQLSDSPEGLGVEMRTESGLLLVSVAAFGSAIPVEAQEAIFSSNYRPEQPSWPRLDGFSLPLAKAIVVAHGGKVWVESGAKGESVFVLSLPLADIPAKP